MFISAVQSMGRVGLPAPIRELAAKRWDAIIVGAGHNGLTCAAYLARAGKRVLVLESREHIGGACTIEEPFPGVHMSPGAYLAGLLHPLGCGRFPSKTEAAFSFTKMTSSVRRRSQRFARAM